MQARMQAVPPPGRRTPRPGSYRAVVFDLDGTLTREVNSWAALQRRAGPDLTERAQHRWRRHRAGELTREDFLREQVSDLAGSESTLMDAVVDELEYHDGVAQACAELHAAGLQLAIISAGITALTARVARDLGMELHRANAVHILDGRFTGGADILVPPGGKAPVFTALLDDLGVNSDEVVSVGDSPGDIDMFRLAGLGVAFNPYSDQTRRAADVVIEHPDMRLLLPYVLG